VLMLLMPSTSPPAWLRISLKELLRKGANDFSEHNLGAAPLPVKDVAQGVRTAKDPASPPA
jgi:hypothetical protein